MYKNYGYIPIFLGFIFLIFPIYAIFILVDPLLGASTKSFIVLFIIICSSCFGFLFWLGLQFLGSFLTIYESGIKIRKPYSLSIPRFIAWNQIKDIKFLHSGHGKTFGVDFVPAVQILLNNRKKNPIEISGVWVNQIQDVFKLMIKYGYIQEKNNEEKVNDKVFKEYLDQGLTEPLAAYLTRVKQDSEKDKTYETIKRYRESSKHFDYANKVFYGMVIIIAIIITISLIWGI